MDSVRGLDDRIDSGHDQDDEAVTVERPPEIGADERRMHVRAYNHWVSLLRGRAYPAIEDLDPESIVDFGPHSVLLDFSKGVDNPSIRYLGRALREECGVGSEIKHVADVPSRSLLSRLTDHYLQIIANRAPIGFEAEFVGIRGHNTVYRGILMPFSSDEDTIDFIYGVINWKELVDAETQHRLNAELESSRRVAPPQPLAAPVWADGPGASAAAAEAVAPEPHAVAAGSSLADRLMLARESAAAARASDIRSRAALYRALGRAYDFALAAEADQAGYAALLAEAGLAVQERAPMTPAAKLVFGKDYDKTRLTEFAAVLTHARRRDIPAGGFESWLEAAEGGIKGMVRAERMVRRPDGRLDVYEQARSELLSRPPLARVALEGPASGFVVLLARAGTDGALDIVASLADDRALTERAVRRAAA